MNVLVGSLVGGFNSLISLGVGEKLRLVRWWRLADSQSECHQVRHLCPCNLSAASIDSALTAVNTVAAL